MNTHNNSEQEMIQNLKDAGCHNEQIQEIMGLYRQGKEDEIHKILVKHRKNVLDKVHKNEKQIACIDYFIYQTERKDKNE